MGRLCDKAHLKVLSVVIHDLYFTWTLFGPYKTHAPLVIDTYRMLPHSVPAQNLQVVPWRKTQVFDYNSGIES